MNFLLTIPVLTFGGLLLGEIFLKSHQNGTSYSLGDWILILSGMVAQAILIPLLGLWLALIVLPTLAPTYSGIVPLGWWGAFALSFVGVDLAYYWQHRLFHRVKRLWKFHICHHNSPKLDVWATARNTFFTNFMFVYIFLNPPLAYLCNQPEAFMLGAMLTASLDLFKHTCIDLHQIPGFRRLLPILSRIFVMPREHHLHHDIVLSNANYGANFIIWDILFRTVRFSEGYPENYQVDGKLSTVEQLCYPFRVREGGGWMLEVGSQ